MGLCILCTARDEFRVTGNTDTFTLSFDYVEPNDVNVAVKQGNDWVTISRDEWAFENYSTIKISPPPQADVTIYRCTDVSEAAATFYVGNSIKAEDLNSNQRQVLNAIEELRCTIANLNLGGGGDGPGLGEDCEEGNCGPGLICFGGICLQPCDGNEVCGEGYSCKGGVCLPDCENTGGCPDGFECSNGTCYPQCGPGGECPDGFACSDGVCKPDLDDAPGDGFLYGRRNEVWEKAIPRNFTELPEFGATTFSVAETNVELDNDAPIDNFTYGRKNGGWDKAAVYPNTLTSLPAGDSTGCIDGTGANEPDGPLWITFADPLATNFEIIDIIGGLTNKIPFDANTPTVSTDWAIFPGQLAISEEFFESSGLKANWPQVFALQIASQPDTRSIVTMATYDGVFGGSVYYLFTQDTDITPLVDAPMGSALQFLKVNRDFIRPYDNAGGLADIPGGGSLNDIPAGKCYIDYTDVEGESYALAWFSSYDLNGNWSHPPVYSLEPTYAYSPFWVSSDGVTWNEGKIDIRGYGFDLNTNDVLYTSNHFRLDTADGDIIRALGFGYCNDETCVDFIWDCYPQSIEVAEGGCYDARASTHGCQAPCLGEKPNGKNIRGELGYKWEEKINGSWITLQDWSRQVRYTFFTDGLRAGDQRTVRISARCDNFPTGEKLIVGPDIIVSVVDKGLLPDVDPAPDGTLPNAPNDGLMYGRKNAGWNKIIQYNINNYPTLPNE